MPEGQIDAADPPNAAPPTFDETAASLRRRLVGLAMKLVWNRDDAEDIVQEAFRLMLAKQAESAIDPVAPWLWRTVCNLSLNHRRRRRAEPIQPWLQANAYASPASALEHAERLERMRAAIEKLPDQQRVALVLRTMESLDYAEIAGIMRLSQAAVRTHVHLARAALARLIADSERDT